MHPNGSTLAVIAVNHNRVESTDSPKTKRIPGIANAIKVRLLQMKIAIHTNLFLVISLLKSPEPSEDILKT